VSTIDADRLRPLRRARQVREFTEAPVAREDLAALADVARWSGSSRNTQPWRFIVITDVDVIRRIAEIGLPQTRALRTAMAAIAIVLPIDDKREVGLAYDDGRAAERILIGAGMLDLGAGIAWVRSDVRAAVSELLELPEDRYVRTIVALGHPTDAARQPKSPPGTARLPREETVFEERWPSD
jgi:nitroreductase